MEAGDTLGEGRYELVEPLGSGGMARVWRAMDHRLGVERAVKVLRPHLSSGSTSARLRFEREARLMARLEHPNVVTVHDVGQQGGQLYLVLSLIPGGSVDDHLQRHGAMPPRQACQVMAGVLRALQVAHAAGVVHRDIKPQNVLVDSHGTPRLTDFGIARVTTDDGLTGTGAIMGTWAYMSPEQRGSARQVDARSDLYSVGAMLCALVLDREPHDLHNPESHDEQLHELPEGLRLFAERCTRYQPQDRFATASDALAALEALIARLPADPNDTPRLGEGVETRASVGGSLTTDLAAMLDRPMGTGDTLGVPSAQETTVASETVAAKPEGPRAANPLLSAETRLHEPRRSAGWMRVGLAGGVSIVAAAALFFLLRAPDGREAPVVQQPTPTAPLPEPLPVPVPEPEPDPQPKPRPAPPPPATRQPSPEPAIATPVSEPLAAPPMGTLIIASLPLEQPVYIDDEPIGSTPLTVAWAEGRYALRIGDGDKPLIRFVDVEEDGTWRFCWDFNSSAPCP